MTRKRLVQALIIAALTGILVAFGCYGTAAFSFSVLVVSSIDGVAWRR